MKKVKDSAEDVPVKELEIVSAQIKDDFCNYSYEILSGVGKGYIHNVKGTGIIDNDLRDAFQKLNAHLAVVSDVFKHKGVDIRKFDPLHRHDLTGLFTVTGFKVKGNDEGMMVSLIGEKFVSSIGNRVDVQTPMIPVDKLSPYQWWSELKEAIEECRNEVVLYNNGKYTEVEEKEVIDPKQLKITDNEEEFENAKV